MTVVIDNANNNQNGRQLCRPLYNQLIVFDKSENQNVIANFPCQRFVLNNYKTISFGIEICFFVFGEWLKCVKQWSSQMMTAVLYNTGEGQW